MKKKFSYLFLVILVLVTSCYKGKNSLHRISISDAIGKERVVNLSEIASEVKYVYFDTMGNSLLGQISAPVFENGYFYLADMQTGLFKVFDKNGKFVNNMGNKGRGPGEYLRVAGSLISFDNKSGNIFVFADTKIIEYSPVGAFIKEVAIPVVKERSFRTSMAKRFNGGFVLNIINISNQKNDLLFINDSSEIIGEFPQGFENEYREPDPSALMKANSNLRYIVKHNEELNVYINSNDTVFSYSKGETKRAIYIQDFGKYRVPADCFDPKLKQKYIQFIGFNTVDSDDYIFFTYNFGDNLPNELAPKIVRGLYNKKSETLQLLKRPEPENSGFKNDVNGEITFWPQYCSRDNYLIMGIPPKDETGNPGVMIVKMK